MNFSVPNELTNLINYQEGAVVSREIIKKETGTVTLFAFDKNEGLSKHSAPYDALIYLLEGEAEVIVDSKINQLKAGQMILMPANSIHSLKAVTRFKMLLVMIRS